MGLLNHLFGSTESIAREIELNDESILKKWRKYLATISKKKAIIKRLKIDFDLQNDLKKLKKLLILELVNISDEEKEESELISDLEAIEHSQKVKRVHKLEQCLDYAATRHEYTYRLLDKLYSILKSQIHLVEKLFAKSKKTERLILIFHIKLQFKLELEIIEKIEQIEDFHDLFLGLIKGELIIQRMDSREKILLKKMQTEISKIFSNEIKEGIIYEWTMTVYNEVQDLVMNHEAIMARGYDPHPDVDFEFVNRPIFVDLVNKSIRNLRKRKVSKQMINVFVHLFREWYNHGRD